MSFIQDYTDYYVFGPKNSVFILINKVEIRLMQFRNNYKTEFSTFIIHSL